MPFISEVSAKERFWAKVDKNYGHGPDGDCWEWIAHRDIGGYGQFRPSSWRTGGKLVKSHIFSYRESFGEYDGGLKVCHKCDNPACVRPDHLFLGTDLDNYRDMVAKGRRKTLKRTKPELIEKVLAMNAKGIPQTEIAKAVGVHKQSVWRITKGITGKI